LEEGKIFQGEKGDRNRVKRVCSLKPRKTEGKGGGFRGTKERQDDLRLDSVGRAHEKRKK